MSQITLGTIVGYLLGLLIIFVSARIFFAPFKMILRFLLNSVIAIGILLVINLTSRYLGLYIPINAVSALTVGILGIPGLCLLIMLQLFF